MKNTQKILFKELENQVILTINNLEYLKLKIEPENKAINNKKLNEDVGQLLKLADKIIGELKKSER